MASSLSLDTGIIHSDTLRDISNDYNNNDAAPPPPSIAALFLIHFDLRKGYTVTWKQSIPDVELDNLVEFKSLPSGLHNVREDLIYFVHGTYAGQSAFINVPDDSAHRNARMLAVGVLVPLKKGRLGKAWMHAPALKELVSQISESPEYTSLLEKYWNQHRLRGKSAESPPESPLDVYFNDSARRGGRQSSISLNHSLAPLHPALSLPEYLHHFGPLVFPLYRLALLRKRILFMGDAPVQGACNYVYDLSLLSTLPSSLLPLLPPSAASKLRPRPLFAVGVHDLPYLTDLSHQSDTNPDTQWIATTTDRILASKQELYDVLVELPAEYTLNAPGVRVYPTIRRNKLSRSSSGVGKACTLRQQPTTSGTNHGMEVVKATQRDARRYTNLLRGLRRQYRATTRISTTNAINHQHDDLPITSTSNYLFREEEEEEGPISSEIIEPLSWSALAYSSFMWWASAGEKDGGYEYSKESEDDARVLYTAASSTGGGYTDGDESEGENDPRMSIHDSRNNSGGTEEGTNTIRRRPSSPSYQANHPLPHKQPREITLISYFRTLTVRIFTVLAEVIERCDSAATEQQQEGEVRLSAGYETSTESYTDSEVRHTPTSEEDEPLLLPSEREEQARKEKVVVTSTDIGAMGLDASSNFDREFVKALVEVWWGREVDVKGEGVRCCGFRLL